jgi:hypothetical protein
MYSGWPVYYVAVDSTYALNVKFTIAKGSATFVILAFAS